MQAVDEQQTGHQIVGCHRFDNGRIRGDDRQDPSQPGAIEIGDLAYEPFGAIECRSPACGAGVQEILYSVACRAPVRYVIGSVVDRRYGGRHVSVRGG
ncbi:non-ribosomal peptide synthetase [Mycolicibacterium brisbanense]|uniref:Non-ribosomal peptide synthetase n=1 Tax=Mycolicibacterium brisbanense TaxID=146020 RepID=A0A100W3U2_9MYCO|nr:non-ribosomal peptide synthetase [Mycolicibacterium brisbanense]